MVRIQRPPKKKKQESLARRLFAAGAAGVTVLTGGVLGLRSAGAVKPPVAQLRLRTDLAAGAGRTPGASGPGGMTVAEEVRIKAETERFLSELRHIDDESKQQRSFLAQLLNISPVQAEVDESALNTEIQRLAASGGLQEAVRDAIVNGGFTADQAAAALQAAGISSSVISDIAVNLGATPGQAAAYAQPSYVPSSEADVYVPPPAAAVLPVSPVAPIIPSPVVEPGPPVLPPAAPVVPVAPSVPASNLSGAWAPRAPGDIPPPLPNPVVPEGESRFVITPGEESVIPERIVYVDNQPVFVTPEGAVLDVNRNQTPYTVDPNGQVFMQGSAAPIGTIQLQSPGIEEVPREVFVPVPPPAPAEPAPAPTPLPAPVTTIEYGGERFRVPLEGGAITTEADAPTPYRFEFEPGRAGDGRVVGPAGEEVGRIRDGAFVPTPPPQVSPPPAPAESQPAPPVVPPAPTPPAPVGPATPLGIPIPAPVAPVGTQVEVDGQVFTVPAGEGFASASGPNGQTTQYYVVAPRPGETDRVVRYGGMFGEEIGKVVETTFVPRPEVATPAPTVATPPSPGPTPAPAPVTLSIGGNTYEINPQTLHVTKPASDPNAYAVRLVDGKYIVAVNNVDTYRVDPTTRVATFTDGRPVGQFAPAGTFGALPVTEARATTFRSLINPGENVGLTSVFRFDRPAGSLTYRVDLPIGFTYVPGTAILRGVAMEGEPRIERRADGGFTVNFVFPGALEGAYQFDFQAKSPEREYGQQFAIASSIVAGDARVEVNPVQVQTTVKPQYVYTDQARPTAIPQAATAVGATQLEPGRTTVVTVDFRAAQAFPGANLDLGIGQGLEMVPGTMRLDGRPIAFAPGSTTTLALGDLAAGDHTLTFEVFWQSFNPGVVSATIASTLQLAAANIALPRREINFTPVFTPIQPFTVGPAAWRATHPNLPNVRFDIDAQGNFRLPASYAFGEFSGAAGHIDPVALTYTLTSATGQTRQGNAGTEGWSILDTNGVAVSPRQPAPVPTQPTVQSALTPLTLQIGDATYQIDRTNLTVTKPANDPNAYHVTQEPNTSNYLIAVKGATDTIYRDTYRVVPATRAGEASRVFSVATNQPVGQFTEGTTPSTFVFAPAAPTTPQTAAAPVAPTTTQPTVTPGGRELTLRINDALYTVMPDGTVVNPPSDSQNTYVIIQATDQSNNPQWEVRVGSREGQTAFIIDARGETKTPQGEIVGGFVAADATVAEYVSGRADYYVRRATKSGQDDKTTIRELVTKGVAPDKIAAATLKEWNNDALRVVRAAAEAGASAEAIRAALSVKTVATPRGEQNAFTVAVGQAVAEAIPRTGAERIQGLGAIARFLRESGLSAGDTADNLKTAGFMDDPRAVLREAGYSEDAVGTLTRRVPASQVRIVNVDGSWLALYPDDRVLTPAATRPATVTEDSLYFSAVDSRFFLGSFPLEEKSWNDVSDKQAFLLYQTKFQADGLDRRQAIAETFGRAIAGWGREPARILRAANLAGLTNVEIVQGLDAADQKARSAGTSTQYLADGIVTALDIATDPGARQATAEALIAALREAGLSRERMQELIENLAPRLNRTAEQLRAALGLVRLERQALLGTFAIDDREYWFDIVGAGRYPREPLHPRGSQAALPYTVNRLRREDGSWDEIFEVRFGGFVVGRLEHERDYEERGSRNQYQRYRYITAFEADPAGVVRERNSAQRQIVGRLRKQADGGITLTRYSKLEYPQRSGNFYSVPGPRDSSGRGPTGAVLNSQGQMLAYVDESGAVTGLFKRFFGQITGAGFSPAYTAQVGAQVFDINVVSGDVYSFAADRGGFKTDFKIVSSGADYEVHQGGTSGPVIAKITAALKVLTPAGTEIGIVKQTDFQQTPTISFSEYIRQKLGVRPGATGLAKQDRWFEDTGSVSPTHPDIVHGLVPSPPTSATPSFGFGTGSAIPLEPSLFDIPRYLDPDIAVAAGIEPGQLTDWGTVTPLVNTDGSLHFELTGGRAFDSSLPVIAPASGQAGNLGEQLPAPISEAQAVEQVARLLPAGVNPESLNAPLVQDAVGSIGSLESTPRPLGSEFLAALGRETAQPPEPANGYWRFEFDGNRFEVPKRTESESGQVKINGLADSSTTSSYFPGSHQTKFFLRNPGPDGGLVAISEISDRGDLSLYDKGNRQWQYFGRIQDGVVVPSAPGRSYVGASFSNEGLIPVLLDQNWRAYLGPDATRLVFLPTGAVLDTTLASQSNGGIIGVVNPNALRIYAPTQDFNPVQIRLNNELVFNSNLEAVQGAAALPRDYGTVFFVASARPEGAGASFAVMENMGDGKVFDYVLVGENTYRLRERSGYLGNMADGIIYNIGPDRPDLRTEEQRRLGVEKPDVPVFDLRFGGVFRHGERENLVAERFDLQGDREVIQNQDGTYTLRTRGAAIARQAAVQRFGSVSVSGVSYLFPLAGRGVMYDNAPPEWLDRTKVVGTGFDSRGQLTGDTGYRLTLGSVELPDGVHQAYLVHQGNTPGIVGLIDRSEEARPDFRGQFTTFTQSSAVLTADGTIRDMTTAGILRGVQEADLARTATASVNEVPPLTLQGEAAPNAITAHGIIIEGGGEPATPVVSVRDPEVGTALRLFSFDKTLQASLDKSLSLSAFGTPLRVVGLSYGESLLTGLATDEQFTFAAEPTYAREGNRQIIEFKVAKRIMFLSSGAPVVQYPQRAPGVVLDAPGGLSAPRAASVDAREVIRYDVESGTLTYYGSDGTPKLVPLESVRFVLTSPEGMEQGSATVFSYLRGPITPERAREVEANLSQNQAALHSLELFARQQNLLPARQPRRLSLYITESNDPDIPAVALWEKVHDDTSAILIAPSVPVLDQSRAEELLTLAHEFGHYVSIDRDGATSREYGLLLQRFQSSHSAADGEALSRFVAEEKRFASSERRADVFSSSVASWFVLSNAWTSEFAYQALAQVFAGRDAAIKKFVGGSSLNTAFALQLHDSPEERLQNMRYAFDFYLRHSELLGGPLALPQAPTGRIQSRISKATVQMPTRRTVPRATLVKVDEPDFAKQELVLPHALLPALNPRDVQGFLGSASSEVASQLVSPISDRFQLGASAGRRGSVALGDEIEITLQVKGQDVPANASVWFDALVPSKFKYVPGSLRIGSDLAADPEIVSRSPFATVIEEGTQVLRLEHGVWSYGDSTRRYSFRMRADNIGRPGNLDVKAYLGVAPHLAQVAGVGPFTTVEGTGVPRREAQQITDQSSAVAGYTFTQTFSGGPATSEPPAQTGEFVAGAANQFTPTRALELSAGERSVIAVRFRFAKQPQSPQQASSSARVKYVVELPAHVEYLWRSAQIDGRPIDVEPLRTLPEERTAAGGKRITFADGDTSIDERTRELTFQVFSAATPETEVRAPLKAELSINGELARVDRWEPIIVRAARPDTPRPVVPAEGDRRGPTAPGEGQPPPTNWAPTEVRFNSGLEISRATVRPGDSVSVSAVLERLDDGGPIENFEYLLTLPQGFRLDEGRGIWVGWTRLTPDLGERAGSQTIKVRQSFPATPRSDPNTSGGWNFRPIRTITFWVQAQADATPGDKLFVGKFSGDGLQLVIDEATVSVAPTQPEAQVRFSGEMFTIPAAEVRPGETLAVQLRLLRDDAAGQVRNVVYELEVPAGFEYVAESGGASMNGESLAVTVVSRPDGAQVLRTSQFVSPDGSDAKAITVFLRAKSDVSAGEKTFTGRVSIGQRQVLEQRASVRVPERAAVRIEPSLFFYGRATVGDEFTVYADLDRRDTGGPLPQLDYRLQLPRGFEFFPNRSDVYFWDTGRSQPLNARVSDGVVTATIANFPAGPGGRTIRFRLRATDTVIPGEQTLRGEISAAGRALGSASATFTVTAAPEVRFDSSLVSSQLEVENGQSFELTASLTRVDDGGPVARAEYRLQLPQGFALAPATDAITFRGAPVLLDPTSSPENGVLVVRLENIPARQQVWFGTPVVNILRFRLQAIGAAYGSQQFSGALVLNNGANRAYQADPLSIAVVPAPARLELSGELVAPRTAASGEEFEVAIKLTRSDAGGEARDFMLQLEFPSGFSYNSTAYFDDESIPVNAGFGTISGGQTVNVRMPYPDGEGTTHTFKFRVRPDLSFPSGNGVFTSRFFSGLEEIGTATATVSIVAAPRFQPMLFTEFEVGPEDAFFVYGAPNRTDAGGGAISDFAYTLELPAGFEYAPHEAGGTWLVTSFQPWQLVPAEIGAMPSGGQTVTVRTEYPAGVLSPHVAFRVRAVGSATEGEKTIAGTVLIGDRGVNRTQTTVRVKAVPTEVTFTPTLSTWPLSGQVGDTLQVYATLQRLDRGGPLRDFSYQLALPAGFEYGEATGVQFDGRPLDRSAVEVSRPPEGTQVVFVRLEYPAGRKQYHTITIPVKAASSAQTGSYRFTGSVVLGNDPALDGGAVSFNIEPASSAPAPGSGSPFG